MMKQLNCGTSLILYSPNNSIKKNDERWNYQYSFFWFEIKLYPRCWELTNYIAVFIDKPFDMAEAQTELKQLILMDI